MAFTSHTIKAVKRLPECQSWSCGVVVMGSDSFEKATLRCLLVKVTQKNPYLGMTRIGNRKGYREVLVDIAIQPAFVLALIF